MATRETAIVFGMGPGLGWALAKRFMTENMQVAAVARDEAKLNALIKSEGGHDVRPYAADVSDSEDVLRVFDSVDRDLGEPDLVVFNAGAFQKANVLDIDPADFERCWRIGCFGGLLVGQAAARRMVKRGHGTIIFTGGRLRCAAAPASPTWRFRSSACARSPRAWPASWDPRACTSAS